LTKTDFTPFKAVAMSIVAWALLGLVSGFITSKVADGSSQRPSRDMALGVLGAVVGGLMFHLAGETGVSDFNVWSIFVSMIGAATVLVGYHAVVGRSSRA
jgi:uncharacterized membrane protein YeaQ/YmgE (transglycosylase-associated protein family)